MLKFSKQKSIGSSSRATSSPSNAGPGSQVSLLCQNTFKHFLYYPISSFLIENKNLILMQYGKFNRYEDEEYSSSDSGSSDSEENMKEEGTITNILNGVKKSFSLGTSSKGLLSDKSKEKGYSSSSDESNDDDNSSDDDSGPGKNHSRSGEGNESNEDYSDDEDEEA